MWGGRGEREGGYDGNTASSKFRGIAVSRGIISIFSNSLSFPSLTITAKTLHPLCRLTGAIQQGPAEWKRRACKKASSNHRAPGRPEKVRERGRERDGAAGEILLFRNCITGICDITIGRGLADIFCLNVREAFLVTSCKVKSVKSFEEMRIQLVRRV